MIEIRLLLPLSFSVPHSYLPMFFRSALFNQPLFITPLPTSCFSILPIATGINIMNLIRLASHLFFSLQKHPPILDSHIYFDYK